MPGAKIYTGGKVLVKLTDEDRANVNHFREQTDAKYSETVREAMRLGFRVMRRREAKALEG